MKDLPRGIEKNLRQPENWEIWAEISYLDSATDYREYVEQNGFGRTKLGCGMVILDASRPVELKLSLITIALVFFLVGAGVLYLFFELMW